MPVSAIREDDSRVELEAMLGEAHAGRVALSVEDGSFRITEYTIDPVLRGQNYSVQLLGQAVKYARRYGHDKVVVLPPKETVPYFEQYGFTVTGQTGSESELTLDISRVIREIPD